MKFRTLKFWQVLALISGTIIACVLALASVSYNATLGTEEVAFVLLPISNRTLFSALALAFDLGMIASVFGFWHWVHVNKVAAAFSAILFVIASLFSVHSVRGYIALNITKSLAPVERNLDVYASLKRELNAAQAHLADLQKSLLKAGRRTRPVLEREIEQQAQLVHDAQRRLGNAKVTAHVSPLIGLDWFLAATLWFFNATCWTAWFGTHPGLTKGVVEPGRVLSALNPVAQEDTRTADRDSVQLWLSQYQQKEPEHCVQLYARYQAWCIGNGDTFVRERKFYSKLIALGARKFRDGRNGPMHYVLPSQVVTAEVRALS